MALVLCIGFFIISIAESLTGSERPLRTSLFGMLGGAIALTAANVTAAVPITQASIVVSVLGGVPGAILVTFVSLLF
ncbi:MAG: hypothetical protein IIY78_08595 [Clostridia bacterium]|nr:hypothetical protein [Clostridia bacterium]